MRHHKCERRLASYDYNGNRIEDERHTYRWDAENRLVANAKPSKYDE
jgi:uncharacterized protein RhaS with RHS repeats